MKGGTEEQRTTFYTALYRVLINPTNMTEDDKYFSPGDDKVHGRRVMASIPTTTSYGGATVRCIRCS